MYEEFCSTFALGWFFICWSYMVASYGIVFGLVLGLFFSFASAVIINALMLLPFRLIRRYR